MLYKAGIINMVRSRHCWRLLLVWNELLIVVSARFFRSVALVKTATGNDSRWWDLVVCTGRLMKACAIEGRQIIPVSTANNTIVS